MEPSSASTPTRADSLNKCVGGSRPELEGSTGRDHSFIERPALYDTWTEATQTIWDTLAERVAGRDEPALTINVSQVSRDLEYSRRTIISSLHCFQSVGLACVHQDRTGAPRVWKLLWDFSEQSTRDLPSIFSGGCEVFSTLFQQREVTIRDERSNDELTDAERHRAMKWVRIQLSGRGFDELIQIIGQFLWNSSASPELIALVFDKVEVVTHSIKEEREEGCEVPIYPICREILNNVIGTARQELRSARHTVKRREQKEKATECPEELKNKMRKFFKDVA